MGGNLGGADEEGATSGCPLRNDVIRSMFSGGVTYPTNSLCEMGSVSELNAAESIGLITESYKRPGGWLHSRFIPEAQSGQGSDASRRAAS